jgi:N-acetylglucosamine kinase-like BadF-type ATPase
MSWKIGVDGGGTKTECILVDGSGTVLARQAAAGSNPTVVGREEAARVVRGALDALLRSPGLPAGGAAPGFTLLCMAGTRAFWTDFAASLGGFGRVVAVDDSIPVLELATEGGPGLVLHAGTGSFVAARTKAGAIEDTHYAGGLGFRFGDPGSGYDIGRRAVARAILELQGWAAPSGLGPLVREATGIAAADAILSGYYNDPAPNPRIAALAPGVLRLATAGDEAAREAAIGSACGLLDLAIGVADRLFPGTDPQAIRAGLSGSILTTPVVARALAIRSPFPLRLVDQPPIEGVRRILQKHA